MRLARSTYYYGGRRAAAEKVATQERIATLCPEVPRYGIGASLVSSKPSAWSSIKRRWGA
jgi:hypothetical protein